MGDCNINTFTLDSLGNKVNNIINSIIALESQGYFVNECKLTKINTAVMLMHCIKNDYILSHKQKHNLNIVIDKFLTT